MLDYLRYLKYIEPARLRAAYTAVLALLAVFGVSIPVDIDSKVLGVLAALAVILPLLQGEWTRSSVYSPATHDRNVIVGEVLPDGHSTGYTPATDDVDGVLKDEQPARDPDYVPDPNYNPANDSLDGNEPTTPGTPGAN